MAISTKEDEERSSKFAAVLKKTRLTGRFRRRLVAAGRMPRWVTLGQSWSWSSWVWWAPASRAR